MFTRILGIDPGIRNTGFAILDDVNGQLTLIQWGEICPLKKSAKCPLKILFTEIDKVIEEHRPTAVALEDTFFAKNVRSALTLGQAKGVAKLAGEMRDIPVFEYSPREVKMAVSGYGAATKDQVKEMVFRVLALSARPSSEHTADAAAVAICHAHSAKLSEKLKGPLLLPESQRVTGHRASGVKRESVIVK